MRILMVATNPDFSVKDGGTTVTRNKLISLLSCDNEVVLLNAYYPHAKSNANSVIEGAHKTYYFKQWFVFGKCLVMLTDLNRSFLSEIKKIVKMEHIDLVCITEPYGITSTSIIFNKIPVIYDAHDVSSDHARIAFQRLEMDFRLIRLPLVNKIIRAIFLSYMHFLEGLACKRAEHVIAITDEDKERFIKKYQMDGNKITVIQPWIPVSDISPTSSEKIRGGINGKIKVIFHGAYRHPANYEAFKLIENYIAPEVQKHSSEIQFILAGTDVPIFEKGNIKSFGYVKNLSQLLASCDIAIVPVLRGTGIRTKTLDYMAAGLPIISTRKGMEGIRIGNKKCAIILNKINGEFVDAILDLAADNEKRNTLGLNSLEVVRAQYGREQIKDRVGKMLCKLMTDTVSL